MAMIANVNRDPKKRRKAYTEKDFIPLTQEEAREREENILEDMIAKRDAMMAANPGMFKKA